MYPRCRVRYVEQSKRHILIYFKEYENRVSAVANQFAEFHVSVERQYIEILASKVSLSLRIRSTLH